MTTLSLDEYRAQVVQELKACSEPARALNLLADVETMLSATQSSGELQRAFWTALSQDLDLLGQQAALLDPAAEATLQTVITTARAVTARALRALQDSEQRSPKGSDDPRDRDCTQTMIAGRGYRSCRRGHLSRSWT